MTGEVVTFRARCTCGGGHDVDWRSALVLALNEYKVKVEQSVTEPVLVCLRKAS